MPVWLSLCTQPPSHMGWPTVHKQETATVPTTTLHAPTANTGQPATQPADPERFDLPYRLLRLRSTRDLERDQMVWFRAMGVHGTELQQAFVVEAGGPCLKLGLPGACPRGTMGGRYGFRSHIVRQAQQFDGVVHLAHTPRLWRLQERQHVRVSTMEDVRYVPTQEARLLARMLTGRDFPHTDQLDGRLADLSGGGCAIRARGDAPANEFMLLWFNFLQQRQPVEVPAQIVGVSRLALNDEPMHRVHLKFRHLNGDTQRAIVRYVFERQLRSPMHQ